jgi:hypothetical protein
VPRVDLRDRQVRTRVAHPRRCRVASTTRRSADRYRIDDGTRDRDGGWPTVDPGAQSDRDSPRIS